MWTRRVSVLSFAACVLLGALAGAAMSQSAPKTTGELAIRYRKFEEKVRTFSAKCDMASSFNLQGVACSSTHTYDVRRSNGVTNIFGVRTATTGFTPKYRHSDGETHQGIDPSEAEMQFSSESQLLWLTVRHNKPTALLGARIIDSDDGVPDPVLEGRRLANGTASDSPLLKLPNGKYQAVLQFNGRPSETIVVDPNFDYMITSRLDGTVESPKCLTEIESVVTEGGIEFPSRVRRKTYNKDGSVNQDITFSYGSAQVGGPVTLWMSRLPAGMTIIGGSSGVNSTDASGKMIRVGTKRKKESGFDGVAVVQFASLVAMFAFGGILLQRFISKRGRSPVVPLSRPRV